MKTNLSKRQTVRFVKHYEAQESRITVDYLTDHGQYHAPHWQNELEMIYLLNGNADIILDGKLLRLIQGEFLVIDSHRVFELRCPESFMQICVRVDRDFLAERTGGPLLYRCSREELTHEQLTPYLAMCDLFKQLVPLYIDEPAGYRLMTESIVLEILFHLVYHFSVQITAGELAESAGDRDRMREILTYIEEHDRENLTLTTLADKFGLSREYFSRQFHRMVGITLTQHILRVRIAHFYHDLISTNLPVMSLLDLHGLTNYKLFSRTFKEIYGCTPRDIRSIRGT